MSLATLDRPATLFGDVRADEGQTLEDLLNGVWSEIRAERTATCPVCGSAMRPGHGSGPRPVVGRCSDCDSRLS